MGTNIFISLGTIYRNKNAESNGKNIFNFVKVAKQFFRVAITLHIPTINT